jgi:hypothetical protein
MKKCENFEIVNFWVVLLVVTKVSKEYAIFSRYKMEVAGCSVLFL